MKKRQPFLAADPEYAKQLAAFSVRDAVLALAYYLLILAVYYFMGRTLSMTGRYLGVPVNLALMILPVLLCLRRLSAAGLSLRNLGRSLLAAAIPGVLYLLLFPQAGSCTTCSTTSLSSP